MGINSCFACSFHGLPRYQMPQGIINHYFGLLVIVQVMAELPVVLGYCRYSAYKIKKKVFHFKMVFLKLKNWFGLWFFIRILSEPLM